MPADADRKAIVEFQCGLVLELTQIIETPLEFKQILTRHAGEPFSLDTETTSDNVRRLLARVKEAQAGRDASADSVAMYASQIKEYTKKNKGDLYDPAEKLRLRDDKDYYAAVAEGAKGQLADSLKALKLNRDALDPHKGRVGVVQLGFNGCLYLISRDVFQRCTDDFQFLVDRAPDRGVFIHNAKFDIKFIRSTFGHWLNKRKLFCTMLAEAMLLCGALGGADDDVSYRRKLLSLKSCTLRRFSIDLDKTHQAGVDWDAELSEAELAYAMTDVITCFHLGVHQRDILKDTGMWTAFNQQMDALHTVCHMELEGMTVDREALIEWERKLTKLAVVKRGMLDLLCTASIPVNYDSPIALLWYLKVHECLNIDSTDIESLEPHRLTNGFVAMLLEYRKLTKLLSTYVLPFLTKMIRHPDGSWRVHGEFGQCLTNTGRFNSSNPNLQNIPSSGVDVGDEVFSIREHVIAGEGWVLIGADLSQVEIRVMADVAGDFRLIEACNNNVDTHALTAANALGKNVEDVTKIERNKIGKLVNLAVPYGKQAYSLSKDIGVKPYKAAAFLNNYYHEHPCIAGFMEACVEQAHNNKYVRLLSGRVRHLKDIDHEKCYIRAACERQSYNTSIQGLAADGMVVTLSSMQEEIYERRLQEQIKLVLTVHDELIIKSRPDVADIARDMLTRHLRSGTQSFCEDVRIEVGNADCDWKAVYLNNWSELK